MSLVGQWAAPRAAVLADEIIFIIDLGHDHGLFATYWAEIELFHRFSMFRMLSGLCHTNHFSLLVIKSFLRA